MMKKNYFILILSILTLQAFAQTDYDKLKSYHKKKTVALGLKAGELTGLNFQIYSGHVCGRNKNMLDKHKAWDFVIGTTRLFNKKPLVIQGKTKDTVFNGLNAGYRMQIGYIHELAWLNGWEISFGIAAQAGQRSIGTRTEGRKTIMSAGVMPSLQVEAGLFRFGSNNKPIYTTLFAEASYYGELTPIFFHTYYFAGGLRFNFWK